VIAPGAGPCACRLAPVRIRTSEPATLVLDAGKVGLGMVTSGSLATIDEHLPGAFGFRIKATESGALFLVLPQRDPTQPRFWCVVVVKCARGTRGRIGTGVDGEARASSRRVGRDDGGDSDRRGSLAGRTIPGAPENLGSYVPAFDPR